MKGEMCGEKRNGKTGLRADNCRGRNVPRGNLDELQSAVVTVAGEVRLANIAVQNTRRGRRSCFSTSR